MSKIGNKIGGVLLAVMLASSTTTPATALQGDSTGTVRSKGATVQITGHNRSDTKVTEMTKTAKPVKPRKPICRNWLVRELRQAGFRGRGLRIAWAIAMRESGGRADAISSTGDYGVFQFNKAAMHREPWWNTRKLLDRDYNIMVAYRISQKGKTFYPWDIDGKGRHKKRYTNASVYAKYKSWYEKYPAACR